MLYKILKKIYQFFNTRMQEGTDRIEKMPLDQQKAFLLRFPEPKDDYQRSFFKYRCTSEYYYYGRKWMLIFYDLGAMLILPFLHMRLLRKGKNSVKTENRYDAVIENVPRLPNADIIPEELKNKYQKTVDITDINYGEVYLSESADRICRELKRRYFRHFYFRLIVMIKLAQFNRYLQEYHPKAVIFYGCEREYAGPLQTLLCEMEGAEYISFMHGDYVYRICFAFLRYSAYYVWDERYKDMFSSLRCSFPTTIYTPEKLKGIAENPDIHECRYFAAYYLSGETRECLETVKKVFAAFTRAGLRCKIRPHPRFSDMKMLKEMFPDSIEIEDVRRCSLADSLTESYYITGLRSTVLSQAYFSGKQIVIDDLSMRQEYLELKRRKYIIISRPHQLLSEIAESVKNGMDYDETYRFKICRENG